MRLTLSIVLALLVTTGSATAVPLAPPNFVATLQGWVAPFNYIDFNQVSNTPITVSPGAQTSTGGGVWDVSISFTGGLSPSAQVSGYTIPNGSGLDLANAGASYQVQAVALPGFPTGFQVPMTVSGFTSASLLPIPGPTLLGFADASVRITGGGLNITEGGGASPQFPTWSQNFFHAFGLSPGVPIRVSLLARGNATGQFLAIADPLFAIDPTATFQHQGQTVRFADAYTLEYSAGLVPEASTGLLLFAGVAGLWRVGRRQGRCSAG
ncbi:MAG: hypothetical protein GY937_26020 [bacterium]|nr:hypothetical protein [bacterium]